MSRAQLALRVADLDAAMDFYGRLADADTLSPAGAETCRSGCC